jgi:hypothetical protein
MLVSWVLCGPGWVGGLGRMAMTMSDATPSTQHPAHSSQIAPPTTAPPRSSRPGHLIAAAAYDEERGLISY